MSSATEPLAEREEFRRRMTELADEHRSEVDPEPFAEQHGTRAVRMMSNRAMYVFDIETEAGDDATIRELAEPFVKPPHPGPFDPSSVRVGNLKDQAKIDAKIEQERQAHQQALASYEADCKEAERKHWQEVYDRAALKAELGRIVVIGVKSAGGQETFIAHDSEADTLVDFWQRAAQHLGGMSRFIGANIKGFDLPFLLRRSWINQVDVPDGVGEYTGRYWNWNRIFWDVRDVWACGQRFTECESSLKHMAKVLGVGEKMDVTIARDFGKLWRGKPEDHELAKSYLRRDLDLTLSIARRLQVIPNAKVSA